MEGQRTEDVISACGDKTRRSGQAAKHESRAACLEREAHTMHRERALPAAEGTGGLSGARVFPLFEALRKALA